MSITQQLQVAEHNINISVLFYCLFMYSTQTYESGLYMDAAAATFVLLDSLSRFNSREGGNFSQILFLYHRYHPASEAVVGY